MIINIISHTMKNIWNFFLVIFLIITFLFIILSHGIRIGNIDTPKIKISQLYIKLDKKLIVNVEYIKINTQKKEKTSIDELEKLVNKLPYLYSLFKTISIKNFIFNNNEIHFLFKDEIFYIDSNFLTIDAKINPLGQTINFDVKQMILKDYEIELKGSFDANIRKNKFNFKGEYYTFNINGKIEALLENNMLYYKLNSKKFLTLKPFMDFFSAKINLHPLIGNWIYKDIVAEEYILHNLEGKFNLKTHEFYPKNIKGLASAKNAIIKFDKNAPPAIGEKLNIILEDDKLIFDIKKANYEGKNISNSKVYIYNLMTNGAGIIIDIRANTMLDESIHKILKAFNIIVPITQTSGKTKANVLINIKFDPFEVKSYTGKFIINDANLSLSGLKVKSKSGIVELDNGFIYIKDANLKYSTLFNIYTNGIFDLKKGIYTSKNFIKSLHVEFEKQALLDLKEFKTDASLYLFKDKMSIRVDNLYTLLTFSDKINTIDIEKLSPIYKNSKLMQNLEIKEGKTVIKTKDFVHYNIFANISEINLPIQKNGKNLTKVKVNIQTDGKKIEIKSTDKLIHIIKDKNTIINIKDLNLTFDSSKKDENKSIENITIQGINSTIIDTNSTLKIPNDNFILKIKKQNIDFTSNYNKQKILFEKTDKTFFLTSEKLSDTFTNGTIGKNIFNGGNFKIGLDGNSSEQLEGSFLFNNTTIKGMTFYNNIMAIMHTIPSLVTLQNPGFNSDGYTVKKGRLTFTKNKNKVHIDELTIDGKSADILGEGDIDFKSRKIDITLKISVLKNLSTIINYIPIANYILLGHDGRLYTHVTIKGTIEKPQISTHTIEDTITLPFELIKRTLETPFKPFMD